MTAVTTQLDKARLWMANNRTWVRIAILALALTFPYLIDFILGPYYVSLAIEVLIFAIFAMSLDILLGYTGLPSFGHAAFFGLGAYIVSYLTSTNDIALTLTGNLAVSLPVVIVGTSLVALLIGFFALRTSGIYFLMITLAAAQMLHSIALSWSSVTGGSDGIPSVQRPEFGAGALSYVFASRESFYFLVLGFFFLSYWLMRRIVNSPFGWTLQGIRENEQRMKAVGYRTFRFKMAAFALAGAFAGLAGMLFAQFTRHASPESLYWTTSGQVMVMLIVGGTGTLTGPILGAGVVRLFPLLVSSYTDRWESLEGLLFIGFVLFAPKGIIGYLRSRREEEKS
jgi:branched-chain amino acid transport system permease protein